MSPRILSYVKRGTISRRSKSKIKRVPGYRRGPYNKANNQFKAKTASKTMFKKKLNTTIKNSFSAGSQSFRKLIHRWPTSLERKLIKDLANNSYVFNNYGRVSANIGFQNYFVPFSLYGTFDLASIRNTVGSNQSTTMWQNNVSASVLIKNQVEDTCKVDIYDIIARRDCDNTNYLPTNAWTNGMTMASAAAASSTYVGCTPFASPLFTQLFVVKKITHLLLGEGQQHEHRIEYKAHRKVHGATVQELDIAQSDSNMGKLTYFCMVVFSGGVANDTSIKTQVSTDAAILDYVWRKEYHYSFLQDVQNNVFTFNQLPQGFTNDPSVMDPVDGIIAAPPVIA
nr:MAG: capsid protein [Cressdnaviricota sp.]